MIPLLRPVRACVHLHVLDRQKDTGGVRNRPDIINSLFLLSPEKMCLKLHKKNSSMLPQSHAFL